MEPSQVFDHGFEKQSAGNDVLLLPSSVAGHIASSFLNCRFFGVSRGLGFCGVDCADFIGVDDFAFLPDFTQESESSESASTLRLLGFGGVLVTE